MNPISHEFDIEACDLDKLRDPLGAGTTLAASFGAQSCKASDSALVSCPEGVVAAQPPVRAEGPRLSGERARESNHPKPSCSVRGRPISSPSQNQEVLGRTSCNVVTSSNHTIIDSSESSLGRFGRLGSASSQTPEVQKIHLVGRRLDALYLAFTLDLDIRVRDELNARL